MTRMMNEIKEKMYKQWSEFKENMNNQIAFRTQIEFKQTAE
jgi:hypothetical protein